MFFLLFNFFRQTVIIFTNWLFKKFIIGDIGVFLQIAKNDFTF